MSLTARDKGGRKWSFPATAANTVDKIEGSLMADTHAVAHPLAAERTHHASDLNVRDATLDCVLTPDSRPGIVQGASVDRLPIDVKMSDHAAKFVALDPDAMAGLSLPGKGRGIEARRSKNKGVGIKTELGARHAALKRRKGEGPPVRWLFRSRSLIGHSTRVEIFCPPTAARLRCATRTSGRDHVPIRLVADVCRSHVAQCHWLSPPRRCGSRN